MRTEPCPGTLQPGNFIDAEMIDREIAGVVWHQRGHRIEVIYVEGTPDHLVGTEAIAALLAGDAGLALIDSPPDSLRWARGSVPRNARPGVANSLQRTCPSERRRSASSLSRALGGCCGSPDGTYWLSTCWPSRPSRTLWRGPQLVGRSWTSPRCR